MSLLLSALLKCTIYSKNGCHIGPLKRKPPESLRCNTANNCAGLRCIKNGVGGEKTDNTSLVQMVLKNTHMD